MYPLHLGVFKVHVLCIVFYSPQPIHGSIDISPLPGRDRLVLDGYTYVLSPNHTHVDIGVHSPPIFVRISNFYCCDHTKILVQKCSPISRIETD